MPPLSRADPPADRALGPATDAGALDASERAKNSWLDMLSDPLKDTGALLGLLAQGRSMGLDALHLREPVFSALWNAQAWAAVCLMDSGEPLEQKDVEGRTLLDVACIVSMPAVVELLIKKGADVNARRLGEDAALHEACQNADCRIADMLLDAGADVHAKGAGGDTPLHRACWSENPDVCVLLVLRGAKPGALNDDHQTPIGHLLQSAGDPFIVGNIARAIHAAQSVMAARQAIDEIVGLSGKIKP